MSAALVRHPTFLQRPDRIGVAAVASEATSEDVLALVRVHGEPNGLKPGRVHQAHIWGSCGADRSVNLNWHLGLAPRTVLEYAVVHELAISGIGITTMGSGNWWGASCRIGRRGKHGSTRTSTSRSATSRADLIAVHPDRGRSGRASLWSIPAGRTSSLSVRQGPSESHRAGSGFGRSGEGLKRRS